MRRLFILLTFILIFCLTQTSEARKLALLVGVDDYVNVTPLKCCVNDMNTLKTALIKIGFEEHDIQMLVTGSTESKDIPTKTRIEKTIAQLVLNAQPTDIIFLALSGHGVQEGKNVYFCPMDADLDDCKGTCVSINKIMDILANKCNAKFKWMVVDACRNDPTEGPKGIGGKGLRVIPTPPAGIALFQSCAEGEESWEDYESGNGFFTKNFAAALSGDADTNHDGILTLMEVCTWTTAKTKEQVKDCKNKSQRPYFSGSLSDFTLTEDPHRWYVETLVKEARKAVSAGDYELAIKKYTKAVELKPRVDYLKQELYMAQKLAKAQTSPNDGNDPPDPFSQEITYKPGEKKSYKVNGMDIVFCYCPPGEFTMGSSSKDDGYNAHRVKLSKGFWMMETEVTIEMFKAFVMETRYISKGNPPLTRNTRGRGYVQNSSLSWQYTGYKQDDTHPVACVSWDDAMAFCQWLSQKTGQNVTLPTEAQWEYACRAGTTGPYAGNLDEMGWYWDNSGDSRDKRTHSVGMKKSNSWGLRDMHGNLWEWCLDYWSVEYPSDDVTDPKGPSRGVTRVIRGGSFNSNPIGCRSATHGNTDDESLYTRSFEVGFRCLINP